MFKLIAFKNENSYRVLAQLKYDNSLNNNTIEFNELLISPRDSKRTAQKITEIYYRKYSPKQERIAFNEFFELFRDHIVDIYTSLPMDSLKETIPKKIGGYSRNEILRSFLPDGTGYQIIAFNFQGILNLDGGEVSYSALLFHVYFGHKNPNNEVRPLEITDKEVCTPIHSHHVPCISCCYSVEGGDELHEVYLQEYLYKENLSSNELHCVQLLDRQSGEHFVSGDSKSLGSNFTHHQIKLGLRTKQ